MKNKLTAEEQLQNVANILLGYTEVKRLYNGRGRSSTYVGNADALALTGRQLADMVLAYLRGELPEVVDDDEEPPF